MGRSKTLALRIDAQDERYGGKEPGENDDGVDGY